MFDLNTTWFIFIAVLIIGYAILDGFDLGVGILFPLRSRSITISSSVNHDKYP